MNPHARWDVFIQFHKYQLGAFLTHRPVADGNLLLSPLLGFVLDLVVGDLVDKVISSDPSMHQEHNVPWNELPSRFHFNRLFRRSRRTKAQVGHFSRALSRTITTFATTERAKFPSSSVSLPSGPLFSDELRDRYPEYLDPTNQRVETWIVRASTQYSYPSYTTADGDLADMVKILIAENEMSALFKLARHPQIPLSNLRHLSWGHHFGFSRVAESALAIYLLVNLIVVMGLLQNGEYLELTQYANIVGQLTQPMDYPAQQLPHRQFLDAFPKDPRTSLPALHLDLPRLHKYLKVVFSLLYRYDLLMRECGIDPKWEDEIISYFSWQFC